VAAIRPGVYLVTWRETNGTAVVHVPDYERDVVNANVDLPGGAFVTMRGRLTRVP
jgi:hypothetical protein